MRNPSIAVGLAKPRTAAKTGIASYQTALPDEKLIRGRVERNVPPGGRSMSTRDFASSFHRITGHAAPHDWQMHLAVTDRCRVVRIGTGLGKTEAVLAAWLRHRAQRSRNMLLSGTLNGGYASPRTRWLVEFGPINQYPVWLTDQVQLPEASYDSVS